MEVVRKEDSIKNGVIFAERKIFCGQIQTHRHEFFEIEYVLEGSGDYIINGKNYAIRENRIFFMTPADFHEVRTDACRLLQIQFSCEFADSDRLYRLLSQKTPCLMPETEHDREFIIALMEEIILASGENNFSYVIKLLSCFIDKLALLIPDQGGGISDDVGRVVVYLLDHFRENVTLEEAASVAGFAPVYFSTVFRKAMGVTFKNYLNDLQFDYAARLLTYTDMQVQEICFQSGFRDYANFTRRFKMRYGMTPKTYRVRNRAALQGESGPDS